MRDSTKDTDTKEQLTLEDALNDAEWGKQPSNFCEYVTVDTAVLASFADFTDEEIAEAMRAIAAFCLDDTSPDYHAMKSTAAKVVTRAVIASHEKRMNGEFLRRYKMYRGAKQRQEQLRNDPNKKH